MTDPLIWLAILVVLAIATRAFLRNAEAPRCRWCGRRMVGRGCAWCKE